MKRFNKFLIAATLGACFSVPVASVYADDYRDRRTGYGADYIVYEREVLRGQHQLDRNYRKHQLKVARDLHKYRSKLSKERRKHQRKMEREFRKHLREHDRYDRYGYENIIWDRGYGDSRRGSDDLSVIIDILLRL